MSCNEDTHAGKREEIEEMKAEVISEDMTLEDMALANLLLGWQPEPRGSVEHLLWLAEQVM